MVPKEASSFFWGIICLLPIIIPAWVAGVTICVQGPSWWVGTFNGLLNALYKSLTNKALNSANALLARWEMANKSGISLIFF